jgi:hypothetical protein
MGVAWSGGPLYADAFGAKRGPSPWQLVESYSQIAFACTEFNALGVSALPLRLYSASGRGKPKPRSYSEPRTVRRVEVQRLMGLPYVAKTFSSKDVEDVHEITSHPFLETLDHPAVDPDPESGQDYFDRPTLIATLCRYLDIVGLAYLKPESESGVGFADLVAAKIPPPLLWPLQAQYVWPVRQPDSALIWRYKYFLEDYLPRDIIQIRLRPSLRDPYGAGYAAAQAAWQYSGLEAKGISMWDQLLGRGARPNMIVSPADPNYPFGEDEARRYQAELNTFHGGGRGGGLHVARFPVSATPIHYPGFDTGEMEINVYNMERMANCWGVPVSFLSSETNLANFQAGRTFHAQFGIEPRAQCLASAFTRIVRRFDPRLFMAFDGAIGEDKEANARIIDMKVKAGIITGNEANSDEPWTPKPWLEEPWIPGTLVQPSMAQERHDQGLEAAKVKTDDGNNAKPGESGERPGGDRSHPASPASRRDVGHNSAEERAALREIRDVMRLLKRDLKR